MIYDSATKIAARIRSGELTPLDVVDRFIERIEFLNPSLNAVVATRFEAARAEAKIAAEVPSRQRGALHGVPITVKEMISVEGMPVTAGSANRRSAIATRDATVVRRLKDEGAIVLGVTNQSELGLWWESNNPVYGRTNNPHDLTRTSGGSSGGEGASIAAGFSAVGIGSDMGGSVRLPAMFCGVYGLKPSGGAIPVSGHFPIEYSEQRLPNPPSTKLMSIGPIARHPEDLSLVFDTCRGPCDEDPNSRRSRKVGTKLRRAFVLSNPKIKLASRTRVEQRDAVLTATEILRDQGIEVFDVPSDFFLRAFDIYAGVLSSYGDSLERVISNGKGVSLTREATRFARKKSNHSAPAWMAVFGERVLAPSKSEIARAVRLKRAMVRELQGILRDDAVLVMPTFPRTAPRHQMTLFKPFDISFTGIFNALEMPVAAAPIGVSSDGLPTGVQIAASLDCDSLCIDACSLLHEATGGAIPPVVE